MLALGKEKDELRIVNDQFGAPTYSCDVAKALWHIAKTVQKPGFKEWGLYHYTGQGPVNWYDFAAHIFTQHKKNGGKVPHNLIPVPSIAFPQKASRPSYSYMSCARIKKVFGLEQSDWKKGIRETLMLLFL